MVVQLWWNAWSRLVACTHILDVHYLGLELSEFTAIFSERELKSDMLRLTKKADYGLMALKYLAEQTDGSAHSAKDIAEAYHIPPQLLAKILQTLAKAGLLVSHAGTNGGYALSRAGDGDYGV